jgi:hypothetical protein
MTKFNFEDDMLEDIHVSEMKYTMLLAKVVDQLKVCISDCDEGRKELAESLLKLIESEENTYE